MIVIPGPIPVAIHPFFWLFAALIGWLNSGSFWGALLWVGVILVSVLIHEFGHALTAVAFKQKAKIQLVALGGLTSYEGPRLKFWKQFLITFNGPLFGFALFLLATALLRFDFSHSPAIFYVLKITQIANLFWTVVNLLPVLPLDGGQLLRIVLEGCFGVKGFRASLLVGAIIAALLSLAFFLMQGILIGAFFFLFAFQSFDSWRKSRKALPSDRDDENRKLLLDAEEALQRGDRERAKAIFQDVQKRAQGGLLAAAAAQYLAFLLKEEGKYDEAYQLLLPIKDEIGDDAKVFLHDMAAQRKNYPLVRELSASCYQTLPSQRAALANARAFAASKEGESAGGWLQAAYQYGGLDTGALLKEELFLTLKDDPAFQVFVKEMK